MEKTWVEKSIFPAGASMTSNNRQQAAKSYRKLCKAYEEWPSSSTLESINKLHAILYIPQPSQEYGLQEGAELCSNSPLEKTTSSSPS